MGNHEPDAVDLLGEALPDLVPERIVEVASEQAGCLVAAYVLDVEGLFALRLAGDGDRFPERFRAPVGVGPELIRKRLHNCGGLCPTASDPAASGR